MTDGWDCSCHGICKVCGRMFRLRRDGTVWRHWQRRTSRYKPPVCPGSEGAPRGLREDSYGEVRP